MYNQKKSVRLVEVRASFSRPATTSQFSYWNEDRST
jgi:hypothetical protein